jgi:cytochrome c oxidase subunit 6a
MLPQRQVLRAAPRFAAQLRTPAVQRRLASSGDNAFIRERQHVKEHAAGSTGTSDSRPPRGQLNT